MTIEFNSAEFFYRRTHEDLLYYGMKSFTSEGDSWNTWRTMTPKLQRGLEKQGISTNTVTFTMLNHQIISEILRILGTILFKYASVKRLLWMDDMWFRNVVKSCANFEYVLYWSYKASVTYTRTSLILLFSYARIEVFKNGSGPKLYNRLKLMS